VLSEKQIEVRNHVVNPKVYPEEIGDWLERNQELTLEKVVKRFPFLATKATPK
jgi:hypothetical protein